MLVDSMLLLGDDDESFASSGCISKDWELKETKQRSSVSSSAAVAAAPHR